MGIDVGANYKQMPEGQEKINFRRTFVNSFATAFKNTGGSLRAFTHWRIFEKKAGLTTVAVDNTVYKKTILFTVKNYPQRKIVAIDWGQGDEKQP